MEHSFDIYLAQKIGVDESIMLKNFVFWIAKNKACKRHQYEGRTWTYNSAEAMTKLFPYWKPYQIRRVLGSLISQGVLMVGNFNKLKYDRTIWYALIDESSFLPDEEHFFNEKREEETLKSISLNREHHFTKSLNGSNEIVTPIPDINTYINTNTNNKPTFFSPDGETHKKIIGLYASLYEQARPGIKPKIGGAEGAAVKKLIKRGVEFEIVESCMKMFFSSKDPFIVSQGLSLTFFCHRIDSFMSGAALGAKTMAKLARDEQIMRTM